MPFYAHLIWKISVWNKCRGRLFSNKTKTEFWRWCQQAWQVSKGKLISKINEEYGILIFIFLKHHQQIAGISWYILIYLDIVFTKIGFASWCCFNIDDDTGSYYDFHDPWPIITIMKGCMHTSLLVSDHSWEHLGISDYHCRLIS